MASLDTPKGASKKAQSITSSSTAEYFSKNLQQVGFSSQTKAVLTTVKEAVDNALDACEEHRILPEIWVKIERKGAGTLKNSERILVHVIDNGPGIDPDDVPKVFGEYLASSKFGRGRCSRGQQGIGISAATTWAQMTHAMGVKVITKTKNMRKALKCIVEVDIKNNKGVLKDKEMIDWDRPNGTSVEFVIDGRIQINGEAGLLNYLVGNVLVNPHLTLHYELPGNPEPIKATVERVSQDVPRIPEPTEPHPHTMKLGEFIGHSHLFGKTRTSAWLKKGFSRVSDLTLLELAKAEGVNRALLDRNVDQLKDADFKALFAGIQNLKLMAPSTTTVLTIGEEALAKSIRRIGEIDFFSVVSRKPTICDFKPVQVEVAIARLKDPRATKRENEARDAKTEAPKPDSTSVIHAPTMNTEPDEPVQVLRFANRVPLQFDKAGCAIVQAISSVNWRAYGLGQPKNALPLGPYIMAVSVVSPFIKFRNASKETIDSSEELVEEIRRSLMQAGQKLSRHIKHEQKADLLEERIRHIEQFGPILVDGLVRITKASQERKKRAEAGLMKILGRDAREAERELSEAETKLEIAKAKQREKEGDFSDEDEPPESRKAEQLEIAGIENKKADSKKSKKAGKKK